MDNLTYRLDRIDSAIQQLMRIFEMNFEKKEKNENLKLEKQKYYSLKEAVKLKTGAETAYTSYSTNIYLMPAVNTHWVKIGGIRMWPAEIIEEWLTITNQDIPEYCRKYGVELVGRQGEKYKKYMKEFSNER